ncbi:MAG: hypothetical protein II364_02950, partial [Bacteroidales bacterium]|nr:hypothetical protein [Bacteroidales bacterium]
ADELKEKCTADAETAKIEGSKEVFEKALLKKEKAVTKSDYVDADSIGDFWSILNVSNNSEMRFYPNYPQTSLTLNFYQNSSLEDSFAFIRVENPSAIAGLN